MTVPISYVTKTYRYLRLAMVTVIFMLIVSLAVEWWNRRPHCFQTSISAYYYTPVQAIFVGTLISIGVCMVALKGNDEWEDMLLNLGGMLAPVVALVPTPGPGSCRSVDVPLTDTSANIANNIEAVFVAGVLALLITIVIALRARGRHPTDWDGRQAVGMAVAVLILVGGIGWFYGNRSGFTHAAHYTAAILLLVCIVAVVIRNALGFRRRHSAMDPRPLPPNRYSAIAVAMVGSAGVMLLVKWLAGWDHALLWIEGVLIALFAAFWLIQTKELWQEGLREAPALPVHDRVEPVL